MGQPNYGITQSGGTINMDRTAVGMHATVNNYGDAEPPKSLARADIGIITVLSEETAAVMEIQKQSPDFRDEQLDDGTRFHTASVESPEGPIRTVLLQSLDQGQRSAVAAYERLRKHYAPPVVVLTGIAGGINPDVVLGDVVISDSIIYYDLRKESDDATNRRGQAHPVPSGVRRAINAYFSAFGEPHVMAGFKVLVGPVGSGEAVVASAGSGIRDFLLRYNQKVLAVEMEAGGIAQAFYEEAQSDGALKGWLTIRGISDTADKDKDDSYRATAARNAAEVLRQLMPFLAPSRA